jgi:hypothetical protein
MALLHVPESRLRRNQRGRTADLARDLCDPLLGRHLGGDIGYRPGTDLGHRREVRRRREHFQRDASLFFHALLENDPAHPDELLARRARAAEQTAA